MPADETATTIVAPGDTIAPGPDTATTAPDATPPSAEPDASRRVTACGVERWSVKTATDPGAAQINPAPVDTTVADMGRLPVPANPTTRVAPLETTTYRVHAMLTLYKTEADSDYHLVLTDHGKTMIAEIPAPACEGPGPLRTQMAAARATFDARFRAGGGTHRVNVAVTVTGVGYHDFVHGQAGVAPNGVELHPVTSITFG